MFYGFSNSYNDNKVISGLVVHFNFTFIFISCKETVIGPDKDSLCSKNCNYFLTHQFKHVFWVLKRTVSLRRFFGVPTTHVLVEK